MKKYGWALFSVMSLFLVFPVWGQEKRWEDVIAAAKKEGKVLVVGSPDAVLRLEIIPLFEKRFGVRIELIAGRSSELLGRIRTERAAGVYAADAFMSGSETTANILYKEKMIDPVKPLLILPEVIDGSKWKKGKLTFFDPDEKYAVRPFSNVSGILHINLDHVRPEEMRSSKDLLNPKWKGKITTEDPTSRGGGNAAAGRFYRELGPEFVKKLYIDMKPVFTRDRRQMTDWLARGTYPICIQCRDEDIEPLRKEGFKIIEIFELTDVPAMLSASPWILTVANKAPHPNATQLFANWILSREALQIYSKGHGAPTLRNDVDESFLRGDIVPKPNTKYFDNAEWNWVVTGKDEVAEKVQKLLKSQ